LSLIGAGACLGAAICMGTAVAQMPAANEPLPTDLELQISRAETAEKNVDFLQKIVRRQNALITEYQTAAAQNLKDPDATARWWRGYAEALKVQN